MVCSWWERNWLLNYHLDQSWLPVALDPVVWLHPPIQWARASSWPNTRLHLLLRLRIRGVMPPLPLYAITVWAGTTCTFLPGHTQNFYVHVTVHRDMWPCIVTNFFVIKPTRCTNFTTFTRVGTLIVATIYLQLIQNRYMFRSFTVFQCSHQHCVQPVASDVEVVGYL